MLDEQHLNPYAARFGVYLFERFPEWRTLASVDRPDADMPGNLEVIVRRPGSSSDEDALSIYCDEEITVGFSVFHCHFGWSDTVEEDDFGQALDFVRQILEDRILVAVGMAGDTWVGSQTIEPGERPDIDGAERVSVRSWSGRSDTDDAQE